jgi:hypothetical protein
MLWRRLLALASAVLLVVGAAWLRAQLFPDETGGLGVDAPRVVCVAELDEACGRLDVPAASVVIEDAAATVAGLAEPRPGIDVWVTVAPWPELAADAREAAGRPALPSATGEVLARSPVLLAARADRLEALEPACDGGAATWRCVGDHAGDPWTDVGGQAAWGRVKVGLDQPSTSAVGLLTLAAATTSWADGAPLDAQLLGDPATFAWLSELAEDSESGGGQSPLERMLLTGGAEYEFTGALESAARPLLRRAPAGGDAITLRRPAPIVTADVVVVGYGAVDAEAVDAFARRIRPALAAGGWRTADDRASEPAAGALPAESGLPSAGVLEELRRTWVEVSGG